MMSRTVASLPFQMRALRTNPYAAVRNTTVR